MKIDLKKDDLQKLMQVDSVPAAVKAAISDALNAGTPIPAWLVTLLKVIAYAIGLVLAGIGTTATAATLFNL